jgi:hypothetical protein
MRLIAVTVLALLALAAPAAAEVRTLAEVHTPGRGEELTAFPVIDAFGGHVVWSDYDATIGAWRLMEHGGGATRALPVAPRRTPFDVDLGPDGRGGVTAAYSRCLGGLRLHLPTPQEFRAGRHGCDLYAFSFTTGRERKLLGSRADEYWPSVWGDRVAFVRGYRSRRDPDRTATPYPYLRAEGRTRRLSRPSSRIEGGRGNTMIEHLDLRRNTVAFAWRRNDFTVTDNFIYVVRPGGPPGAVAHGATSGGDASERVRSVSFPAWDGEQGVHWLFTNRGEPEYFGAFAYRGQASPRTKAVAFAHAGGIAYFIDGGPGARFEPNAQPGGSFALRADDAVAYSRRPGSWQPVRPPR